MKSNIFEQLSEKERTFLEELSLFSKLKEREKMYSQNKMTTAAKINYIYENRMYMNNENRRIMNDISISPNKKFLNNVGFYCCSFVVMGLLNVIESL
jgi:hypothetical protein